MYRLLLLLFFIGSQVVWAQKNDSLPARTGKKHILQGIVIDGKAKTALKNAHIINLNAVTGVVSDSNGRFRTRVQVNDTLYFSYLGYQSIKLKVSHDLLKGNDLEIAMYELPVTLDEVQVKPYQLIGVLEVDAKNVPVDNFARIHINGLPQTYEIGAPVAKKYNTAMDLVFHPVDFMYELFGKKPKQLRKLKKLRSEDALRSMLEEKANREVLMEYLEMDKGQLHALLDYCNYSEYFIQKATDLQVIEAVLECYENFKALKNGSTKRKRGK